jgi:hypothetical protein
MKIFCYAVLFIIVFCTTGNAQPPELSDFNAAETLLKRNPNAAFLKIKQNLNSALKDNNETLAALAYQDLGELFYYQAAYSQSVKYFYKANEIFTRVKDKENLAKNLNKIGAAYYYGKQYGIARSKFSEAQEIYKQLGNRNGMATSHGLIGQTHEKIGQYQTSMRYQRLALKQFQQSRDNIGLAKIYENMGSVYEDTLPMDSALKYYSLALNLNKAFGNEPAQLEIINNIGDVYRKTNRYKEALSFTKIARDKALKLNDQYQLSASYRDLSKTYDLMKKYDSAYHYSELGRNIFLQIFTEDNNKQLALLQTLFEIQQKDDAIERFENDRQANHYIIMATVLIILLLISLAASIISRQRLKIRNEQKLNEQNQSLYEAQKSAIGAELELKSKELTSNTLHVIQSNQFLDELRVELLQMVKDEKRDQKKQMQHIVQKITQNINHDNHWKEFSSMFEQIHQTFFDNLKKYGEDLTANDLRLVALIKMNLSSKDMALLFGISQDSLRVARYRLRKKLNIAQGENLSTFIQTL